MTKILLVVVVLAALAAVYYFAWYKPKQKEKDENAGIVPMPPVSTGGTGYILQTADAPAGGVLPFTPPTGVQYRLQQQVM